MSEHDHPKGDGHPSCGHDYGLKMKVHGLTCQEISQFMMDYLDSSLDDGAKDEFERHVGVCPPCLHYLDGYKDTVELVRRCGKVELDAEAKKAHGEKHGPPPEGLIMAILAAKQAIDGQA